MTGRLVFDVSSLARWTGPPVGIARAEHALARCARERGAVMAAWDRGARRLRRLRPEWADTVLGWQGAIDTPDPAQSLLSRHRAFAALERVRLTRPSLAGVAGRMQDALLAVRRHGHRVRDAGGGRIAQVPRDLALGEPIEFGPEDTLFSAGSDWFHVDVAALGEAKRARGFRAACLCYDLIPITHPRFYADADVALVTGHWRAALRLLDLVVVNAHAVEADLRRFCAAEGIAAPRTEVLPLGYDPPAAVAAGSLPAGLEKGRFALFVSTIEPRKGHALLLRAWRRLLAEGVPQRHRFELVFVGRPGWMVDDVLGALRDGVEGVRHLQGVGDETLGALYGAAAFALYPSEYEGFGLPVIEAFARGLPVLASCGGALAETVAGRFPCLPPDDETAWTNELREWIERPPSFGAPMRHPDWTEAAGAILDRVMR